SINFSVKDISPFKKAALQKAFTGAKEKAEIIAASSGLILKRIKSILEAEAQVIPPAGNLRAFAAEGMGAGGETPVAPGNVEIRGGLTIIYDCGEK
ncbi:MAG: SIMPL domain-containing protein, partial [Candidatus Margulisbacteria bacterium]|nr:SIMPL domain-containing protein [Candidatus Margulisiibacteriota bacterium]